MLGDIPRVLPVEHLSVSSVNLFLKCPQRWKYRYIDGLYEPTSPAALLGGATGAAEGQHYGSIVDGGPGLSTREVLDAYSDEFDLRKEREEVDWEGEKPGRVKDQGARVLPLYHHHVAPTVKPIAVEREFVIRPPHVDWTIKGYIDVEETDRIPDLKSRSTTKGPVTGPEAAADLQATTYLFARRAEDNPAREFVFHSLVRNSKPTPRHVTVTPTTRTDEQLDQLLEVMYGVAAEIQWRMERDVWRGPPAAAWWCGQSWCGFWERCPLGGLHRPAVVSRPRPARPPRAANVLEAAQATMRRDGTTTAARVADHLGLTTRQASARLTHLCREGKLVSARPTKTTGRGKDKITVELRGDRVYRLPGG